MLCLVQVFKPLCVVAVRAVWCSVHYSGGQKQPVCMFLSRHNILRMIVVSRPVLRYSGLGLENFDLGLEGSVLVSKLLVSISVSVSEVQFSLTSLEVRCDRNVT